MEVDPRDKTEDAGGWTEQLSRSGRRRRRSEDGAASRGYGGHGPGATAEADDAYAVASGAVAPGDGLDEKTQHV